MPYDRGLSDSSSDEMDDTSDEMDDATEEADEVMSANSLDPRGGFGYAAPTLIRSIDSHQLHRDDSMHNAEAPDAPLPGFFPLEAN